MAIDDAHWADESSLRWLTYLARRLDGLDLVLLVALRPADPAFANAPLLALRAEAPTILSPTLLSENAVGALVRATLGSGSNDELCEAVWTASGGNPLYDTVQNDHFDWGFPSPADFGVAIWWRYRI